MYVYIVHCNSVGPVIGVAKVDCRWIYRTVLSLSRILLCCRRSSGLLLVLQIEFQLASSVGRNWRQVAVEFLRVESKRLYFAVVIKAVITVLLLVVVVVVVVIVSLYTYINVYI